MKMLVLTVNAGYRHSYISTAIEVLVRMALESKAFDIYVTEDASELNKSFIKNFNSILFLTSGEIPVSDDVKQTIIDFVYSGGGFIGVHNAADTFYSFPQYGEMLGGYFHSHPWTGEAWVIVRNRDHPSTRHLPNKFRVFDEIYVFKNFVEQGTEILIELDTSSVDMTKAPQDVKLFPLVWCRKFGSGRVFYTAFGHFTNIWREKWFQQHLLGGILWVLNM